MAFPGGSGSGYTGPFGTSSVPRAGSARAFALQRARASQFYGETPAQWNAAFQKAFRTYGQNRSGAYRLNTGTGGGGPAPAPAPVPGAGGAAQGTAILSSGSPPPTPASPLDAQYYQNVAANQFKVNNQVNSLNQQRGTDTTALQTSLAQLAYQQPRQSLSMEQRANRTGGLYSSAQAQNEGNLQYQFAGKQAGAQSQYQNQVATIASRIAELQQGIPIYNQQQYLAAVERATQAAQSDPSAGQPDTLQGADTSPVGNTEATPSVYGGGNTGAGGGGGGLARQATALANRSAFRGESKAQWNNAFRAAYNSLYRKGVR